MPETTPGTILGHEAVGTIEVGSAEPSGPERHGRSALSEALLAADPAGMYTRHDVAIDRPAHDIRREMLGEPERWLPASVGSPLGERRYLVRVGFRALAGRISKEVELTVGAPDAPGDWLVVPVAWRATGREGLFPVLDGKLTVQPLGPHSSILWIGATYQPPLCGVGHELNDVALHNVASATIEDFVEGVAVRLTRLAASHPG